MKSNPSEKYPYTTNQPALVWPGSQPRTALRFTLVLSVFACSAFVKYEICSPLYTLELPTIVRGIMPSRGRRPARVEMFKKEVMGTWLSPG